MGDGYYHGSILCNYRGVCSVELQGPLKFVHPEAALY